jgi:hypothetical protein
MESWDLEPYRELAEALRPVERGLWASVTFLEDGFAGKALLPTSDLAPMLQMD